MQPRGHLGLGLAAYAPLAGLLTALDWVALLPVGLLLTIIAAYIPDIDIHIPGLPHRGPTHTVAFGAGWSLLNAAVPLFLWPSLTALHSPVTIAVLGALSAALGVLSHLAGDVITPSGLQPWWPIDPTHYAYTLTHADNTRANLLCLIGGVASLLITVTIGVGVQTVLP